MKTKLTLLTLLILVGSCSSERKCRRAINKAEKLGCLKTDSITIYDTLILASYDTTVQFKTINDIDTLIVENGGIKTVVFTKWKTREVRVVQKSDTIVTERKVPQVVIKKTDCPKDRFWCGVIVGVMSVVLLIWLIVMAFKWIGKNPDNNTH